MSKIINTHDFNSQYLLEDFECENKLKVGIGTGYYTQDTMPDYEYRPSKYNTVQMSAKEKEKYDLIAKEMFAPPNDIDPYVLDHKPHQLGRKIEITSRIAGVDLKEWDSVKPLLKKMNVQDIVDLDAHMAMKSGYMLSLFGLVSDTCEVLGEQVIMDFYCPKYKPKEQQCYESGYSEDVPEEDEVDINGQLESMLYRRYCVSLSHFTVFMHNWSTGLTNGISERVRKLLSYGELIEFDFTEWLKAERTDIKPVIEHDNGQAKIFLSSLRAFSGLEAGRITVLVLGSASHPVKSGYSYHALARILSLSGFSGVFELFDPTELHQDCQIDSFQMNYFKQSFNIGGTYKIEGKEPTVILDDTFGITSVTVKGVEYPQVLGETELAMKLLVTHKTSRVSMKHLPSITPISTIKHQIMDYQFSYVGQEQRIYYRCGKHTVDIRGLVLPDTTCRECWYFASLLLKIGNPQANLRPYWIIFFGLVGVHCKPVPGIRNIHFLASMRHELLRGHTKEKAKQNLMENSTKGTDLTMVAMDRLQEFAEVVDPVFRVAQERYYPPTHDEEMAVRSTVGINEMVDHLTNQTVAFSLSRSQGYSEQKFEKLVELFGKFYRPKLYIVDIVVYHKGPILILDDAIYVENMELADLGDFTIYWQNGFQCICYRTEGSTAVRLLFDRGRGMLGYVDDEY